MVLNFVEGVFEASETLRPLVEGRSSDTIRLASNIDILVRPASYRSTRGPTRVAVIADELAFWRIEGSAQPDTEILRALKPSLLTTKGPLIAISSPYARRGELWKAYKKHYGKDAERRIKAAERDEEIAAGSQRAERALSIGAELLDRAQKIDAALAVVAEESMELDKLISELNINCKCPAPNRFQLESLGTRAINSALMFSPFKLEHMAPRERRTFVELFSGYANSISNWATQWLSVKEAGERLRWKE